MKKLYTLVALTACATLFAEIKEKKSSKSFYCMEPFFSLGSKIAGWRSFLYSQEYPTALRITGGMTRSYKSDTMSRYFLMNNKESLKIRGSAHADYAANTTDIRAEWLGLPNNFEGTLSIKPNYESWGIMVSAKTSLQHLADWKFLKYCSFFIDLPIVHTRTKLNFEQTDVSNAAGQTIAIRDILTAFNNSTWNYQKISTLPLKTLDLAEIRVGIATSYLCSSRALVALSSAFSAPTTSQYKNEYMFEPQTGYNGHPAMISTIHMNLPLTLEETPTQLGLFVDAEHAFLLRTKQYRTFDLKNKEWSRFLLFREKDQATNTTLSGVNVLTRNVRISPYSMFDVLCGLKMSTSCISGEIGFGAWGHHNSRIKFTDEWPEIYGIAGSTTNTSSSASTITTRAANDNTFTIIKESDIDLESAISPAKVIYKAHATVTAQYLTDTWALFGTVGLQMNVPRNSTNGFKTWSLWLSSGTAF